MYVFPRFMYTSCGGRPACMDGHPTKITLLTDWSTVREMVEQATASAAESADHMDDMEVQSD